MTYPRITLALSLILTVLAVGGYVMYDRPDSQSKAAAEAKAQVERPYLPKAEEGTATKAETSADEVKVMQQSKTISLKPVTAVREGTVITGTTTDSLISYRIKGRYSGLVAHGEVSVPGTGSRPFSLTIQLVKPVQPNDSGTLELTGGDDRLITEVTL